VDNARLDVTTEITALGGTIIYAIVAAYHVLIQRYDRLLLIIIGYSLSILVVVAVKTFYFKDRPCPIEFTTYIGKLYASSFPSLHSMRAFMFAIVFGSWIGNSAALTTFLCLAAAVAWSRTKLKMHYWLDVFAGAAIGIVLGILLLNL